MSRIILAATLAAILSAATPLFAIEQPQANTFAGQDLHLSAKELLVSQPAPGKNILVFENKFTMSIGANTFSADGAVVWLQTNVLAYQGRNTTEYFAQVFLSGDVSMQQSKRSKTTDITTTVARGKSLIARFVVTGDVFVTAESRKAGDPNTLRVFQQAVDALQSIQYEPFVKEPNEPNAPPAEPNAPAPQPEKIVLPSNVGFSSPYAPEYMYPEAQVPSYEKEMAKSGVGQKPSLLREFFTPAGRTLPGEIKPGVPAPVGPAATKAVVSKKKLQYQYPVNIVQTGETKPKFESTTTPDGLSAATIIGRFYLWQKLDDRGGLLELQADNAVVFYRQEELSLGETKTGKTGLLASGAIKAIYLTGNVVMNENSRTVRADELYYDFEQRAGLAINAEMRLFDERRNIPIYVRASKLRQISDTKFAGEKAQLTNSEFYLPQISLNASSIVITDETAIDEQGQKLGDNYYVADLRDVRLNYQTTTLFHWSKMEVNSSKSDVPLKSLDVSYDNTFGLALRSQWYLSRVFGLRQPEGTNETFLFDAMSKRGIGTGANVTYNRENYFGSLRGYIMNDNGTDNLGRLASRKDIEPSSEIRGRFAFQHRQFLADGWQLTVELSYLSDRNYLEEFSRAEFTSAKEQETLIHLKKIQDNWGLSFLAKKQINSFQDQLEQLPSVEYHRTGESLFDNKFTFYSDSQISRLSQKIGDGEPIHVSQENYTFASTRNEIDLPLTVRTWKFVPFAAGTAGYDDRSGFRRSLVDGENKGPFGEKEVGIGELGMRGSTQYWTVYPEAESRLLDIHQLRHLVKPYFVVDGFTETDSVVKEKDMANVGILQRWQTKRGEGDKERTVDWMRLDTSATFVEDPDPATTAGPDRFIWNQPSVPLSVYSAPQLFNGDLSSIDPSLARFESWGPRRNMFQTDYVWRTTETLAVLSDFNYDLDSQDLQQVDIGYSHLVMPHLSYYLGERYMERTEVLGHTGSNIFTAAITYIIDPRYTITFAEQYDFSYGANLRNEVTILRRYHRVYYGLSFSADASLDRQSIMLSIWPEGVPELTVGSQRYTGLASRSEAE